MDETTRVYLANSLALPLVDREEADENTGKLMEGSKAQESTLVLSAFKSFCWTTMVGLQVVAGRGSESFFKRLQLLWLWLLLEEQKFSSPC